MDDFNEVTSDEGNVVMIESRRNMHVWKNAQMTRTNNRIKQGNTRKNK
jgi:hypothetical protein